MAVMNNNIDILYEDNHLLVVVKPVNIPVQEDSSNDQDFLTILKQYIKEKYQKPGDVYLGLIHRLDRPVGGVMVFARTSKAASRLSDQVRTHKIEKKYLAVTEGYPQTEGHYTDYLYKDVKTNMVKTVNKEHKEAKKADLDYKVLQKKDNLSLVEVSLITGRSHQIRVQFSSRKYPLWGDQRYNPHAKKGQQIALWAYELSFYHPTTKEKLTFSQLPPDRVPYNLFR